MVSRQLLWSEWPKIWLTLLSHYPIVKKRGSPLTPISLNHTSGELVADSQRTHWDPRKTLRELQYSYAPIRLLEGKLLSLFWNSGYSFSFIALCYFWHLLSYYLLCVSIEPSPFFTKKGKTWPTCSFLPALHRYCTLDCTVNIYSVIWNAVKTVLLWISWFL